ncbi:Anaphase-promoting complex subunit 1 [Strongyloides ratti]|uniref:Anaphase-promoting complex subunit 1 n=1 Tax=Strongyloides ratti TaxID=34506 RepID=A0A090LCS8_STRRB|nr:Anaphase-promoting complex subunit 1 [Strongyloides ratti]CEF67567.1 Anaphase-promoting complex subunit 1 [Strongyloides ratti]
MDRRFEHFFKSTKLDTTADQAHLLESQQFYIHNGVEEYLVVENNVIKRIAAKHNNIKLCEYTVDFFNVKYARYYEFKNKDNRIVPVICAMNEQNIDIFGINDPFQHSIKFPFFVKKYFFIKACIIVVREDFVPVVDATVPRLFSINEPKPRYIPLVLNYQMKNIFNDIDHFICETMDFNIEDVDYESNMLLCSTNEGLLLLHTSEFHGTDEEGDGQKYNIVGETTTEESLFKLPGNPSSACSLANSLDVEMKPANACYSHMLTPKRGGFNMSTSYSSKVSLSAHMTTRSMAKAQKNAESTLPLPIINAIENTPQFGLASTSVTYQSRFENADTSRNMSGINLQAHKLFSKHISKSDKGGSFISRVKNERSRNPSEASFIEINKSLRATALDQDIDNDVKKKTSNEVNKSTNYFNTEVSVKRSKLSENNEGNNKTRESVRFTDLPTSTSVENRTSNISLNHHNYSYYVKLSRTDTNTVDGLNETLADVLSCEGEGYKITVIASFANNSNNFLSTKKVPKIFSSIDLGGRQYLYLMDKENSKLAVYELIHVIKGEKEENQINIKDIGFLINCFDAVPLLNSNFVALLQNTTKLSIHSGINFIFNIQLSILFDDVSEDIKQPCQFLAPRRKGFILKNNANNTTYSVIMDFNLPRKLFECVATICEFSKDDGIIFFSIYLHSTNLLKDLVFHSCVQMLPCLYEFVLYFLSECGFDVEFYIKTSKIKNDIKELNVFWSLLHKNEANICFNKINKTESELSLNRTPRKSSFLSNISFNMTHESNSTDRSKILSSTPNRSGNSLFAEFLRKSTPTKLSGNNSLINFSVHSGVLSKEPTSSTPFRETENNLSALALTPILSYKNEKYKVDNDTTSRLQRIFTALHVFYERSRINRNNEILCKVIGEPLYAFALYCGLQEYIHTYEQDFSVFIENKQILQNSLISTGTGVFDKDSISKNLPLSCSFRRLRSKMLKLRCIEDEHSMFVAVPPQYLLIYGMLIKKINKVKHIQMVFGNRWEQVLMIPDKHLFLRLFSGISNYLVRAKAIFLELGLNPNHALELQLSSYPVFNKILMNYSSLYLQRITLKPLFEFLSESNFRDFLLHRFPEDIRYQNVLNMLDTSKPVLIQVRTISTMSDSDIREYQEDFLTIAMCKYYTKPFGKAIVKFRTVVPDIYNTFTVDNICVSGKVLPMWTTIDTVNNEANRPYTEWGDFYNGTARGLEILSADSLHLSSEFLTSVINNQNQKNMHAAAGLVYGLGLNGHINRLNQFVCHEMLTRGDKFFSIALLLGFGASNIGSADQGLFKIMASHLKFLMPPTQLELTIDSTIQASAAVGLGLLFCGRETQELTDKFLKQMCRENYVESDMISQRYSFSLACGFAVGLINLGKGNHKNSLSLPISDAKPSIAHRLLNMLNGGAKEIDNSRQVDKFDDYFNMSSVPVGTRKRLEKSSQSTTNHVRELPNCNIHLTAHPAAVALGLVYLDSNIEWLDKALRIPESFYELKNIKPDVIMTRTIARLLIGFRNVKPTKEWAEKQIPISIRQKFKDITDLSKRGEEDEDIVYVHAYFYIYCGALFVQGLKFASTWDERVIKSCEHILPYLEHENLRDYESNYMGVYTNLNLRMFYRMIILSVMAMVKAGSGDVNIIRLARHMKAACETEKIQPNHANFQHSMCNMALGMVMLGGSRYCLGDSPLAIASLFMAFYPVFPKHIYENRLYLQPLRFMWTIATEPRMVTFYDIQTKKYVSLEYFICLRDGVTKKMMSPSHLPTISLIKNFYISSTEYIFHEALQLPDKINREELKELLTKFHNRIPVSRISILESSQQQNKMYSSVINNIDEKALDIRMNETIRDSTSFKMTEFEKNEIIKMKDFMVLSTKQFSSNLFLKEPIFPKKPKSDGEALSFVDYKRVLCKGGRGGNGMVSFFKGYRVPFGGPDGGDGGNGGHVIFKASKKTKDLSKLKGIYKAGHGEYGMGKSCHGKNAEHRIIHVPLNTIICKPAIEGISKKEIIKELINDEEIFLAARGGAGGHGNQFYVSNEVRKPIKAEIGGMGEEIMYDVEMGVMAFGGFVGFPNVGKSTLLRSISRAKPKVASYPFTTLKPHIGIVEYDDFTQISIADIPGLIEGAHMDYGLGSSFLQHIKRCYCLIYVIDVSLGNYESQFEILKNELNMYKKGLTDKPSLIILSKMDLLQGLNIQSIQKQFNNIRVFPISSRNMLGLKEFLVYVRELYDFYNNDTCI